MDDKASWLMSLNTLQIHTSCRKHYTRPSSISASVKRKFEASTSSEPNIENENVILRSLQKKFDFKTSCFLCGEFIGDLNEFRKKEDRKSAHLRTKVCEVQTLVIQKKCLTDGVARKDKWGDEVVSRISSINDLVAEEAIYHSRCRSKFSTKYQKKSQDEYITAAMEEIYSFMENNVDCQFTLQELRDAVTGEIPDDKVIKSKLIENFEDRIFITKGSNRFRPPLICFTDTGNKILTDSWYDSKSNNADDERLRIVKTAAEILRNDIQRQVHETSTYPPRDDFLRDAESCIPQTLLVFLEDLMLNKTKKIAENKKKCVAVAHSIMATVRPRTFSSSILNSLSLLLYRKYASKNLVNLISSLGFCSSYYDAQILEMSAVVHAQPQFVKGSFSQFVFDNADYNVRTLDGMNTFHALGGITCITPLNSIENSSEIRKLSKMPTSGEIGAMGVIPLETFQPTGKGLGGVILKDLAIPEHNRCISEHDALWLYAKLQEAPGIPEWKGYMHCVTKGTFSEKTKVIPLPFINAPPSNYDTIFTALKQAKELCDKTNQKTLIITFDQPLYIKCREIVALSPADSVMCNAVVRLGGFHLLMSFLGCIGYLMGGSGLKEVLSIVYAPISVDHMLEGHAFARAVRGHLLVQTALSKIIFNHLEINNVEMERINEIMVAFQDDPPSIQSLHENPHVISLADKFGQEVVNLASHGPTAQLWIQYFTMVNLVKEYIHAERSGDWDFHLECVKRMIPFFHASGHFNYAKSCHLYVQDMQDLPSTMPEEEFKKFVSQGYFTMRRSDCFWSGVWSDMIIETTLMRAFKSRGGLTRGRGVTDSVISKWVLGTTATHDICVSLEEFCGVLFSNSEQHVDFCDARKTRDSADTKKISTWFDNHDPFPLTDDIMSIATGVVGDATTTCYKAVEVGKKSLMKIHGKPFADVKLSRKERALPLSSVTASIKIQGDPVIIDPLVVFQRISISKQSDDDLKTYLRHELAPFPLALFNDAGMRKTQKSVLYSAFKSIPDLELSEFDIVIDGGLLLHRVTWSMGSTISAICDAYLKYVKRHYSGKSCTVIFDGYDNTSSSTKCAEQRRRYRVRKSVNINCTEDTVITIKQDQFLSNQHNKSQLIALLKSYFEANGVIAEVADDDADTLIVSKAIEKKYSKVVIIGEDIDLLVLLIGLTPLQKDVTFFKPSRGKTKAATFSSKNLQQLGLDHHILFIHAFTGCDTTCATYRKGKISFLKMYRKNAELNLAADIFLNDSSTPTEVENAGRTCFLRWYGAPSNETSLNT